MPSIPPATDKSASVSAAVSGLSSAKVAMFWRSCSKLDMPESVTLTCGRLWMKRKAQAGTLSPADILNHFINDEDEYKEVASLFNTSLSELSKEEREKAFAETVKRVKRHSLEEKIRNVTDISLLQKLMKEQAGINGLHISLN